MTDYWMGLAGGAVIGLGAALLYGGLGKIAGVSGVLGGLMEWAPGWWWRLPFVIGLFVAGLLFQAAGVSVFMPIPRSIPALVVAGLLVGFGTRLAGGCTSGHGVCGVSRFSRRSLAATATFIVTGVLAVFVINRFLGGRL